MTDILNKRRVTMRSIRLAADGATIAEEAVDFVPVDILDAYVTDARTRWQSVSVGDEVELGPGGSATVIPEHLDVPDAGTSYAALEA